MIVLYVCGFVHLSTVPVEDRSTVGCESPSIGSGTHTPSLWKSSKHPEPLGQPLFGIFVDFFNVEQFFALTQQTVVKSIVYVRLPRTRLSGPRKGTCLALLPRPPTLIVQRGPHDLTNWGFSEEGETAGWIARWQCDPVLCWQSQGMCLFQMRRATKTQNTGLGLKEHMQCGRTG